ncbi:MAG TPA: lysophospholipase [Acidimicrobiia bacterium]|nr:lysophospholipase [Acidimicrobiia bacterium]
MIESRAHPQPAPDGGVQLVREWAPTVPPLGDIVIVHGLGEHSGRYERTGSLLAEGGYQVRSFDLIGFGASSGKRGDIARWSLFLDQVEGHLDESRNGDRPVILLGPSMGGLIALDYALSERPQPDLLVLSAPGLTGGKAWQRKLVPHLARLFPTMAVPSSISGDMLSRDPAVGEAYFADPLVLTKTTARLGASILSAGDRARGALERLRVPTLVLHGGTDTLVPTVCTEVLAGRPAVVRRVFPALRHEIFNEPEGPEVVAEIIDWIRSMSPAANST